jgi:catechol 2,3-dioxygenase-like lactoylglutathione lyase family enzyme
MVYPRRLAHVGVTVPDVEAAVDWYCETLGFDVIASPETFTPDDDHAGPLLVDALGEFERVTIAHLGTGGGTAVEFLSFSGTGERADLPPRRAGWAHVCVVDEDVAGLAARIDAADGDHYAGVHELAPGEPYELTYCRDPFGNRIEIYSHSDERLYS